MKKNKFENIEAEFIAKMVADNLGLGKKLNKKVYKPIKKSTKINKVLKSIEAIENTWRYRPDHKHSYGRKTKKEVVRFWSLPKKSALVLQKIVGIIGAKKILEVGTSVGYSTLYLAHAAKQFGGKVYTIELLKPKIDLAKDNFLNSGLNNIALLEGKAEDILQNWTFGKVDMVFLDADKENYGKYFDLLMPLLRKGSLIVADNINDYGHLMEDYLQKVSGTHFAKSRVDKRVKSYYLAQLDNGLLFTKKINT